MLIGLKDSHLLFDNKPVIGNLQANIEHSQKLMRLKFCYVSDKENHSVPFDIALKYSCPEISGMSICLNLEGRELNSGIYSRLQICKKLTKSGILIRGKVGKNDVNISILDPKDFGELIRKIAAAHKPDQN